MSIGLERCQYKLDAIFGMEFDHPVRVLLDKEGLVQCGAVYQHNIGIYLCLHCVLWNVVQYAPSVNIFREFLLFLLLSLRFDFA